MARPKKIENLTPAEIRTQKAGLKEVLKATQISSKSHAKAVKAVTADFERIEREANKAVAAAQAAANKTIKAAAKTLANETKAHAKAIDAAAAGIAKVETQLQALEALPTAAE